MSDHGQSRAAISYLKRLLQFPNTLSESASYYNILGICYINLGEISEANKMFLKAEEIYSNLVDHDSTQFNLPLAKTLINLWFVNTKSERYKKPLNKYHELYDEIKEEDKDYADIFFLNLFFELLNKSGPAVAHVMDIVLKDEGETLEDILNEITEEDIDEADPDDAEEFSKLLLNLGQFYENMPSKWEQAERMYDVAIELMEPLVENTPRLKLNLAKTSLRLGLLCGKKNDIQKIQKGQTLIIQSLKDLDKIVSENPEYTVDLAIARLYAASVYTRASETNKIIRESIEICKQALTDSVNRFKQDDLESALICFLFDSNARDTEKFSQQMVQLYKTLIEQDPDRFGYTWMTNLAQSVRISPNSQQTNAVFVQLLEFYDDLLVKYPARFGPEFKYIAASVAFIANNPAGEKIAKQTLGLFTKIANENPEQLESDLMILFGNLGCLYTLKAQFTKAENHVHQAIDLVLNIPIQSDSNMVDNLVNLNEDVAILCDSLEDKGHWSTIVSIQTKLIQKLSAVQDTSNAISDLIVQDYGLLSCSRLFTKSYVEAEAAACEALQIDPSQNWLLSNVAHSYLLRHDWKIAKELYEQYIGNARRPSEAKTKLLDDLEAIEREGIRCPEITTCRQWLEKETDHLQ
jgi:tetratricopeptide (TPR) repeat protein